MKARKLIHALAAIAGALAGSQAFTGRPAFALPDPAWREIGRIKRRHNPFVVYSRKSDEPRETYQQAKARYNRA